MSCVISGYLFVAVGKMSSQVIIVEPDGNGFHAYCPTLKGLHVSGATREEAMDNAKEAITAYLASMMKHGDPLVGTCSKTTI